MDIRIVPADVVAGESKVFRIALAEALEQLVAVHTVTAGEISCFTAQTQKVDVFGRIDGGFAVFALKVFAVPERGVASVGHVGAFRKSWQT